jgi:SAM-dependent methyltransferase
VGTGADGIVFAQHGARYTGVDLTETAVDAATRHFEMMGQNGVFQTENAEKLSFEDESFDIVYSFGVLHQTAAPFRAIDEVFRVLRPGGLAKVMLYHKHSFNYYVRIMGFMRAKVVLRILSRIGHWREDRTEMSLDQMVELRGNRDRRVWNAHYAGFLEQGWRYLGARSFVHHCTDGPTCPLAYTFTRREAENAFSAFSRVDTKVAHLPFGQYTHGLFPRRLERQLASRLGWNLVVFAHK